MTVSLSTDAAPLDVEAVLLGAWRAGSKGITVYRYDTRPEQVLQQVPADAQSPPMGSGGDPWRNVTR